MMPTAMPNISAFSPSSLFICSAAKEMLPRSRMARKYIAITNHIRRIATLRIVERSSSASVADIATLSIATSVIPHPRFCIVVLILSRLCGQAYLQSLAADAHAIGRDVDLDRAGQRLAGADVEAAHMQGAFDLAAVEFAVGQLRFGVSADIAGGVVLAADAIECDVAAGDLDAERRAFLHIAKRSRRVPGLGVG